MSQPPSSLTLAVRDIQAAFQQWFVWHHLTMLELKQRYSRSTLGPFWLTASMLVTILTMGVLVGIMFNLPLPRYLPYLSASLLVWNLITTVATEAVMIFISSHSHLTSHNRPRFLYVLLAMWRTIVIWLHVSPIYIVIGMIYGTLPGIGGTLDIFSGLALLLVGIFLLVINCTWLLTILAILAVRFRDVPMIVTNLINAAFWLTPVIYYPEQLGEHAYFLNFNPLTHLMEVVRSPLMGEPASMLNYLVCTIAAVVGSLAALVFFSKFRARITYWI